MSCKSGGHLDTSARETEAVAKGNPQKDAKKIRKVKSYSNSDKSLLHLIWGYCIGIAV